MTETPKPDPDVDNHPPNAEERELREYPLDLAVVRTKLADKQGKQYWRTLEELSDDPHFSDLLHREFPRAASEWDESVDRRDFLKLMGASLALVDSLVRMLMEEFAVKTKRSYADSLQNFAAWLIDEHKHGRKPVVILDEAQNLTPTHLKRMHFLLN